MATMCRSSADLFAELNRMHSVLDRAFRRDSNIRSIAGAGFPTLNMGSTPAAIELQALGPGIDPIAPQVTVVRRAC